MTLTTASLTKVSGPDGVQEFLFGDELAWTLEEIVQHCEGLGSEFYCLRSSPQTLVDQVEAKGIEDYLRFVPHGDRERYQNFVSGLRSQKRGRLIGQMPCSSEHQASLLIEEPFKPFGVIHPRHQLLSKAAWLLILLVVFLCAAANWKW